MKFPRTAAELIENEFLSYNVCFGGRRITVYQQGFAVGKFSGKKWFP
jgi:hypothetical protein